MPRKQPSGAQNRKKRAEREAALKNSGQLMPRAPSVDKVLSLTGVIREKAQNYVDWKRGLISAEQYWTSIRGLSALAGAIASREAERQREIDEQVLAKLEAVEGRHTELATIEYTPAGPVVSELMPRDENPPSDEVNK